MAEVLAETTESPDSRAIPDDKATDEPDADLKDRSEQQSQQYFFSLMQKRANYTITSEEEGSKYLRGIWRLDRRAHVGGGHYVRADQGDDVTVVCTDEWLVQTEFNRNTEPVVERVKRIHGIIFDSDGSLSIDASRKFQPLDADHMAIAAYDYIAVLQRIVCESPEPGDDGETAGVSKWRRQAEELPDRVTALAGWWRINPDFNRLISSPVRQDGQKFPKTLRLGIALPGAPVLDKDTLALLEDRIREERDGRSAVPCLLVFKTNSAYSNLGARRTGTPSQGRLYLILEGGPSGCYEAVQVVSFNLSWLLDGRDISTLQR